MNPINDYLDNYFYCVKNATRGGEDGLNDLVNLFSVEAKIVADGIEHYGHDAIRVFYKNGVLAQSNFCPMPVENSRVLFNSSESIQVDIFLHCDKWCRLVRDIFEYSPEGLIVTLRVTTISVHVAV